MCVSYFPSDQQKPYTIERPYGGGFMRGAALIDLELYKPKYLCKLS